MVAAGAALAVTAVGIRWGTYAAGGSDSSCYSLMAEAFANGALQPASDLASRVPWPDAAKTFAPGGFVPSATNPGASSPVCAPGFSLLLAPFAIVGGLEAIFLVTPLAGALLIGLTFVAARAMAGPLAGAMAAVLIAASPAVLYQVVQPMNDIATAALWMGTYVALLSRRWMLAGACCGLAILVRPNLLPLALIATFFAGIADSSLGTRGSRSGIGSIWRFAVGAFPFGMLVLLLNNVLYGGPFRTGYGQLGSLFSVSAVPTNATRYLRWLIETQTPFTLLALVSPLVLPREKRFELLLAFGLIVANCGIYFFYTPFDDWSYLRFLLPAIALLTVLASATLVRMVESGFAGADRGPAKAGRYLLISIVTAVIATSGIRIASGRLAFTLRFLEQRYRSAGIAVRDRLPANAVVLSAWDSGAVRFHGRKESVAWDSLDPAWLDRSLDWLDTQGHTPYILTESWEEERFRARFEKFSEIGRLDWPPKYEIDRVVRIFDPKDRSRYQRGERIDTEYVWPLRDAASGK
jgi:hypothetical protein